MFGGMFELPISDKLGVQGASDDNAIFLEQITARELGHFLSYIYME